MKAAVESGVFGCCDSKSFLSLSLSLSANWLFADSPENITSNGLPEEGHGSPILVEEPGYPMENVDNEVTPTPDGYAHAEMEEVSKPAGTSWAARISQVLSCTGSVEAEGCP